MTLVLVFLGIAVIFLTASLVVTSKRYKKEVETSVYWKKQAGNLNSTVASLEDTIQDQLNTIEQLKNSTSRKGLKDEVVKALQGAKLKGFQVAGMKECVNIVKKL